MLEKVLRVIFVSLFIVLGVALANQAGPALTSLLSNTSITGSIWGITLISFFSMLIGGIIGGAAGIFASSYLTRQLISMASWVERSLTGFSTQDILLGTLGLFLGLIIANLVGLAFIHVPIIGFYVPVVLSIVLGYTGLRLSVGKKNEITGWFRLRAAEGSAVRSPKKQNPNGKLLDTSVIIDGRIDDLCRTGFIEGPLIVPVFVLEELQKIADSSDILKRNRGRRGLDILNHMRKNGQTEIRIVTDDFDDMTEVDSKLVKLAQKMHCKIMTNDYNLNKVAELQGVTVLNLNDLANALKPAVIPGEQLFVQLVKSGKEEGQGVAYLEDGTMIVVENGHAAIGREVSVTVTSVLQTSAGRMIFARLDENTL
ncbi:MAG TPA: PIN/TRAM domain-containing protein [Veillonellaceae bacterium]|nr:PIN/TRAM domain-containing protein [Veillonellaceae bacterium]